MRAARPPPIDTMTRHPDSRGFSLVELLLVLSVLALLSGIVVPRVTDNLRASRDARRLEDVKELRLAIEQYKADRGVYPQADTNPEYGNWDVSHDGGFIPELVRAGYLRHPIVDPINDNAFHYRYYVYEGGSYGCDGGPFYVLGVKAFESAAFEARNRGFFRCADRDWGEEFAFVTGGGASWSE